MLLRAPCVPPVYSVAMTKNGHYFAVQPETPLNERTSEIVVDGNSYEITRADNIFSADGLDKGTAVLLHKVPRTPLETSEPLVLDLGCGWGPLSLALAHTYPQAEVLAVDVNERALHYTQRNLQAAGYTNVRVQEASQALETLQQSGRTIDLIWSNPPIRIGKEALHEMLCQWLTLLSSTGRAYLVVQKNLGADSLHKWLNENNFTCTKLGSAKGFRILEVTHAAGN